jgi:crotonobetainyl-CoA:carnitine CoA-transferase CaiB-like acyl-CoA transferase
MATSDDSLILQGLRVIDAATYIAAPAAAAVLSDFGAEVVKIERPPHGDPFRHLYLNPEFPPSEHNYPFIQDNRNKRSLALNLASSSGHAVFSRLVQQADILVTNYQPQMQRRFRIGYEDLASLNPRLIYAAITGYGETGEEAEKPGYDMTAYYARSGLMNYMHAADASPHVSPCGFGDHPTAMNLVSSILLALYRRERTGKGGKVWTTLMHGGVWSNASHVQGALFGAGQPPRWSRATAPNPFVNHYRTADGQRFIFCLLDPVNDWPKLCRALGRPELEHDPRWATAAARMASNEEFIALLDAEFIRHPLAEWRRRFAEHDVLYGIVPDNVAVANDKQMAANGVFLPLGDGGERTVSSPMHLEGEAKRSAAWAPAVGQHTRQVLGELGYDAREIADLESAGVVLQG